MHWRHLHAANVLAAGQRNRVAQGGISLSHEVRAAEGTFGMALDELARSEQPFYSTKRGGTGLGLSIASDP